MAELVAEAFLSAMFEKIFEKLISRTFVSFFRGKKSIDKQLKKLKKELEKASLLIDDAEDKQISEPDVKTWLDDLKDVVFRADDLTEEINAEARAKKEHESGSTMSMIMNSISPDQFTEFDKRVQEDIAMILEDLDSLLDKVKVLALKGAAASKTRSSRRVPAPLRDERHVYGRDSEKEEIFKLLLSDEVWGNQIGVLAIVGMGGLGKTTLAQLVYDDDRVKKLHGFELRAWVTVSTEFDILKIVKNILQQVSSPTASDVVELSELQRRLKEALRGKKFFFVLDDVWDEDYSNWDVLKSCFTSGERGSRIVVTTRSQKVASIVKTGPNHELRQVSKEDCWKIFRYHAFDESESNVDPHLKNIGEKIVDRCKGLPLAVRSVGGLLRPERNPRKWESILASPVWEWYENKSVDILPSLWLSYRYLPPRLKQCFAYCSIYPKDYEIEEKQVILLWMAQGFLQCDQKEKTMEEVGEEYIDVLMSRSLFQKSRQQSKFIMHDLVHDLAIFVASEFCFRFDDEKRLKHLTRKTRHVSHQTSFSHDIFMSQCDVNHLRTFISLHSFLSGSQPAVEKLMTEGRCLRVFSPGVWTLVLSDSIANMKHLRYLSLSETGVKELPSSLCTLYNLQSLLLVHCENLTRLPKDLERLNQLRHLDTTGTPLKEMPPHMGNMKELQTLTDFVLGDRGCGSSIIELGALLNLRGKIRISRLQNIEIVEDVLKAGLKDKDKLTELTLVWKGDVIDTIREKKVLEALQPHPNLMKLEILGYAASSFPVWVGDSLFSELVSMRLIGHNDLCHSLPPLGQLPSLRELVVGHFHGVEKIGAEFYTGNKSSFTPFPSLETLKFIGMESWTAWSFIGQDGREGECFPCLKHLYIDGCPNLAGSLPDCHTIETPEISESYNSMEFLPLDHFPKLEELRLKGFENLNQLIAGSTDVIEKLWIWDCYKLGFPGSCRYVHVKELTISGNDSIESLPLDYFPRLEKLYLYRCRNLASLTFTEEPSTTLDSPITYLRIGGCKNLRSLPEHMNRLLPNLSHMTMENCPEIESFPRGGLPSNLRKLSISKCGKLVAQHEHWDMQGLTSLRELYISDFEDMLDSFPEGLLPSSLTTFALSNFPHLKSLNGSAFQNVTSLVELKLVDCNELQFLPQEVLLPTSLSNLWIYDCPSLERRYEEGNDGSPGVSWKMGSGLARLALCVIKRVCNEILCANINSVVLYSIKPDDKFKSSEPIKKKIDPKLRV